MMNLDIFFIANYISRNFKSRIIFVRIFLFAMDEDDDFDLMNENQRRKRMFIHRSACLCNVIDTDYK